MADHYYTPLPESEHNTRLVQVNILGRSLTFETDAGVFSKNELDPGSRLLIEAMGGLSGRVLDLGCGWGPVGVSLGAANPEAQLVLSDVNERAVALAQKNIRANGLTNAQAVVSDAFSALSGSFDHVVTNPPIRAGKQAIYAMFDEAHERLTPGGTLTIVIRKQQGAPSAQKHLLSVFGNAETIARGGGYHVIQCRKEEHHD